jgi:hypothetical protein
MSVDAMIRELWNEARWQLPNWLWRDASALKEYAILLTRPYLNALRLRGQTQAGPITLTYAISGADSNLKWYLESLLFVEQPLEEKIGNVPYWRIGQLINSPGSDLTLVGASKYLIHRLPTRNALVLPRLVNQTLDVRGDWDSVVRRLHPKLRRHELRLVRKYGYEYEVSDRDEDFETFYHRMYLPSMQGRHGRQALVGSYERARRHFKGGILFLVKREGRAVSGGLCYIQRGSRVVNFLLVGVLDADARLFKEGAQGAVYNAVIHWAHQRGYAEVDFQATDPFLAQGVLQHKRKWGATATIQSYKRLWIKVHRNTPAVNRFLKDNPCIIINPHGDLQALFVADDPSNVSEDTRSEWESLSAMPGLNGYLTLSAQDLI